jgi:4-amino-4-deoxy-L-arabinose transferase-like glycosyltransferase
VAAVAAALAVARARTDGHALALWLARLAPEVAVVGVAAGLRLVALARVPVDPYYDAAVRSMGTSWAALLTGAFEPGRRVAIDKPPVDLWLQVGGTKLLGFTPLALHLPEALGGVALVVLLMMLLRALFGRSAALAGGLALAVLPSAVVTARSDTMDSVMAALAVAGTLLVVRAARRDRLLPLAGAGVVVGLAFDVKLAEALLPAVAGALLWLLIAPRRRWRGALLGATAFAVTAVAWLLVVSILPLHPRPWALGSTTGSPWQSALVYNGIDRIVPGRATHSGVVVRSAVTVAPPVGPLVRTSVVRAGRTHAAAVTRLARAHAVALSRRPGPPSPTRLLSARAHLGRWIGIEAVAALAALAAALALGGLDRIARGGLLAIAAWLVGGLVLCSAMPDLRPRYLACVDPAVAAALGAGLAVAIRGRGPVTKTMAMTMLVAVVALPAITATGAVVHATQDSGRPGALPDARVATLAAYLQAHGAQAALAASAPAKAAQLIARGGRPTLILSDGAGRALLTPAQLAAQVAAGRIRYALLGDACTAGSGNGRTGCLPVVRWARHHGTDVSRAAGQPRRGVLFALDRSQPDVRPEHLPTNDPARARPGAGPKHVSTNDPAAQARPRAALTPPAAGAAASGRTPRSATSSRTPRSTARSAVRRASRGPGGRAARARRASRHRTSAR